MIPDGCFHMVINLGAPHLYTDKNGNRIEPKRSHINVMQTEFVTVERSGHVEIMGVVFRPHGLYSFMRMPISELTGQILNLDDLLTEQIDLLEEQLASIPTIHENLVGVTPKVYLQNRDLLSDLYNTEIRESDTITTN